MPVLDHGHQLMRCGVGELVEPAPQHGRRGLGIEPGGGDVLMAEEALHVGDLHPQCQQTGGHRVPQQESTVNTVIGKRFAKKQQMQWTPRGAHLLLQTRTRALDGTLRAMFERWYPGLANDNTVYPG